ncbi:MAG: hypothetical protein R3178_07740, partial [Rhodothermales bacterium]|nr:hypothetical protein [Rhodothermales bacterium]
MRNQRSLRWGGLRGKFMLFSGLLLIVVAAALTYINFLSQQHLIIDRAAEKAQSIARVLRASAWDDLQLQNEDGLRQHLAPLLSLVDV